MTDRRLRVGAIGLGGVAVAHLEAYSSVRQIEVVAGAEVREDRLAEMAGEYGFTPYTSYEEMLERERLDIACVLTPVNTHRQFVETVADHGVHVFCEKPLALRLEDAEAMIAHCDAKGVKLFYGASYRFMPTLMKAKELIADGVIGDVYLLMEMVLGGRGPEHQSHMGFAHYPEGGPGGSGMGLVDHGIHLIDLFGWLMSDDIEWVFGRGGYSGKSPTTEHMTMSFANGAVGQLVYNDATFTSDMPGEGIFSWGLSWTVDGKFLPPATWNTQPGNIRIHGTKGALRIYHYANQLFLTTAQGQEQVPVLDRPTPGNFGLQMESFATSVLLGEPPEVTGQDGLKALKAVLATYESFETRQLVHLKGS